METQELEDIENFIEKNKSDLQANFLAIKKRHRFFDEKTMKSRRMTNSHKLQTDELLIDKFYKKISRLVNI